ncbi:hypothetical protein PPACK8108_LOCUS5562 [Phakopsora pachyrhizi]|uniref:Uncharacterized protein n=1 Tax=Phakopsora pachyrhizi TaxID=170000 RepID=A0AAV0AQQ8_PHAPC|nr:hypothetical protein PPACK8108_LOCUS5562 [Phakopsora pachyrhizi]
MNYQKVLFWRQFLNTVVGRYPNRLPTGKSTLKLSDRSLDLTLDENTDAEIFKRFEEETRKFLKGKFENINQSRKSCREEIDEDNCHDKKVSYFYLKSPAGNQGFPECLDILATISISIDGNVNGNPSDSKQILLGLLSLEAN